MGRKKKIVNNAIDSQIDALKKMANSDSSLPVSSIMDSSDLSDVLVYDGGKRREIIKKKAYTIYKFLETDNDKRFGATEVVLFLGASDDDIQIKKHLTAFDWMVLTAFCTIYLLEKEPENGAFATKQRIANIIMGADSKKRIRKNAPTDPFVMENDSNSISAMIAESVARLESAKIQIIEGNQHGSDLEEDKFSLALNNSGISLYKFRGPLLPISYHTIEQKNGKITEGYRIDAKPEILKYMQLHNKLLTIPICLLENTGKRNTVDRATLRYYLLREIHVSSLNNYSRIELYVNSIFLKNNIDLSSSTAKRQRLINAMDELLSFFEEKNFILTHTLIRGGKKGAVVSIEIELCENSNLLSEYWHT